MHIVVIIWITLGFIVTLFANWVITHKDILPTLLKLGLSEQEVRDNSFFEVFWAIILWPYVLTSVAVVLAAHGED